MEVVLGTEPIRFSAYVQPCTEYVCKNSKKCIPKTWVCDGSIDCGVGDDSDETSDCSKYRLDRLITIGFNFFCIEREHCDLNSGRYFKCSDSDECLPITSKCDAHQDCADGSDERGCACTCPDKFSCQTTCQCLNVTRVCDGVPDCIDQTDERNCTCSMNEYSCLGGACINRTQLCDGMMNCPKGDDETHPDCSGKHRLSSDGLIIHVFSVVTTTTVVTTGSSSTTVVPTVGTTIPTSVSRNTWWPPILVSASYRAPVQQSQKQQHQPVLKSQALSGYLTTI